MEGQTPVGSTIVVGHRRVLVALVARILPLVRFSGQTREGYPTSGIERGQARVQRPVSADDPLLGLILGISQGHLLLTWVTGPAQEWDHGRRPQIRLGMRSARPVVNRLSNHIPLSWVEGTLRVTVKFQPESVGET